MRLQGDRRRRGKEEEVNDSFFPPICISYSMADLLQLVCERRAVEEAKQQLGEEQLAVVELVNQLREVRLMEEQEALEMGREAAIIR